MTDYEIYSYEALRKHVYDDETEFVPKEMEKYVQAYNAEGKMERKILEFCDTPKSRAEITEMLGIKTSFYTMERYVNPMIEKGILQMTMPEKPKSKFQKYYRVR